MGESKLEFSTYSDGTEVLKEAGPMGRFLFKVEEQPGLGCDAKAYRAMLCAAPEMLKVLKRVEADLTHLGAKGEPLKSIRAAIARAEGGAE